MSVKDNEREFLHALNGTLGVLINNMEALETLVLKMASPEIKTRIKALSEATLKLKTLAADRRDFVRKDS